LCASILVAHPRASRLYDMNTSAMETLVVV